MSTTATITNVCQIAEEYGKEIGLADFAIERIVHVKWKVSEPNRMISAMRSDNPPSLGSFRRHPIQCLDTIGG